MGKLKKVNHNDAPPTGRKINFDEFPGPFTSRQTSDKVGDEIGDKRTYLTPQQLKGAIDKERKNIQGKGGKMKYRDIYDTVLFNASEAFHHGDLKTFTEYAITVSKLWYLKKRDRYMLIINSILPELANGIEEVETLPDTENLHRLLEIVKDMKTMRITDRIDSLENLMVLTRNDINQPLLGQKEEFKDEILNLTQEIIEDILEYPVNEIYEHLGKLESLDIRILVESNLEFFKRLAKKYNGEDNQDMIKKQALFEFMYCDSDTLDLDPNLVTPEELDDLATLKEIDAMDSWERIKFLSVLRAEEITRLKEITDASLNDDEEDLILL